MRITITDVKVNTKLLDKVTARLADNLLDDETKTEINEVYAELIDPWTPYLTGQLSKSAKADERGVTYNVPYAEKKYYGTVYTKDYHPLATDHWDEVGFPVIEDELKAKAVEIVKRRLWTKIKQLWSF